ncbi:polysaccharide biosynthesis tyrosine autokinase [Scytonema sp. UIC 10036]|uniref:GumC family protein n=1 Tax=Scytonema sp. UIC 10036 TaxID=2304196 RepID=UPI0012DA59C5|nr:polysaccharide biosynthesis tyrosine autokinase [Scytonema sp. UIC 10036]MUG99147.1 polysaccharide biosynthesis tyrosine autokinase [Scytonema sp. UIC 10036]
MEKNLTYLIAVLKRQSLPAVATFAAVICGAFAYLSVTPRLYETSARLMLDSKSVSVSELGRDLIQMSSATPGGANPLADQAELVMSQRVLERAIALATSNSQRNSSQPKPTAGALRKKLKVKIVPATNILELIYQDGDPEQAVNILNAVSQTMVENNIKAIRSEATKVREFLEQQVPLARTQLQQAETSENKYRQISGLVSSEEQTKTIVESIAVLENQERALLAQRQEVRSRKVSLQQITQVRSVGKAYAAVRGGQDEELKKLRAKLAELEQQVIQTRLRFTEQHPTLISLTEQRDTVRALYQQELARVSTGNRDIAPKNVASDQLSQDLTSQLIASEVESRAIENKLKLTRAEKTDLLARLAQIPIKQQQLTTLSRKREEAAVSLKFLQSKLEEARIAEAQKVSNIHVIEEATLPTSPASPNVKAILVLAVVFGAILATGVMLVLEVMDNTLRDASEAEKLLQLPLIGVLPQLPATTLSLAPGEQFLDNVGLVEPYRTLFKNLEFRSPNDIKLIVVSSTISGEGKSIVASHLAAVSAMLSRRTLIIDADLRRPIQHALFNVAPRSGISDVIYGHMSLLEAVQPTTIENLSVLTYGNPYGRPSQLLESVAMKSLLAEAAERYDLVIIDTPPLSVCADSTTLGKYSDGIIIVTRPSFTVKEMLQKSVSELTRNRIPILGVVVNGMTSLTEKYYRYPKDSYQPTKQLMALESSFKNSTTGFRSK